VLGLCGRAAGLAPRAVARLSLYEDAATVVSAAVKLMPIDPADATVWLAGCAMEIDLLADAASAAARDGELPAVSTPLLDRRALDHDHTTRRLFAT
jgi:urease accessory protein